MSWAFTSSQDWRRFYYRKCILKYWPSKSQQERKDQPFDPRSLNLWQYSYNWFPNTGTSSILDRISPAVEVLKCGNLIWNRTCPNSSGRLMVQIRSDKLRVTSHRAELSVVEFRLEQNTFQCLSYPPHIGSLPLHWCSGGYGMACQSQCMPRATCGNDGIEFNPPNTPISLSYKWCAAFCLRLDGVDGHGKQSSKFIHKGNTLNMNFI